MRDKTLTAWGNLLSGVPHHVPKDRLLGMSLHSRLHANVTRA